MNLGFAGLSYCFRGIDQPFADALHERYDAFLLEDVSQPDLVVDVTVDPDIDSSKYAMVEQPIVSVESLNGGSGRFHLSRADNPFDAHVDLSTGHGSVCLVPSTYCFDGFLRVLSSLLLAQRGGALLHGVAIKLADSALIAVGESGAGKTTLSRQGFAHVFSDELVAVTRQDHVGFEAHSTPFWGEGVAGRVQDSAPLKALHVLRKGEANRVEPESKTPAVLELLGCTFFFGPSECCGSALDLCSDIVESTFAGQLFFRPTSEVVPFLEERMLRVR